MAYCWTQVVERAVTHADNVYNIPNVRIEGRACQTNLPSNTAFRGFGGPQGMIIIEQIVTRVSHHLRMPAVEVCELNMYKEGDCTPYDMVLSNCTIRKCWVQLKETSAFTARRAAVDQFNQWVIMELIGLGSLYIFDSLDRIAGRSEVWP